MNARPELTIRRDELQGYAQTLGIDTTSLRGLPDDTRLQIRALATLVGIAPEVATTALNTPLAELVNQPQETHLAYTADQFIPTFTPVCGLLMIPLRRIIGPHPTLRFRMYFDTVKAATFFSLEFDLWASSNSMIQDAKILVNGKLAAAFPPPPRHGPPNSWDRSGEAIVMGVGWLNGRDSTTYTYTGSNLLEIETDGADTIEVGNVRLQYQRVT